MYSRNALKTRGKKILFYTSFAIQMMRALVDVHGNIVHNDTENCKRQANDIKLRFLIV